MKKLLSLVLLVVASSALADDWPTRPFTFIGIPEKIRIESHQSVHGKMQNMVIRVIEVKEGSYDKPEIGFDFPVGSKPPLEIGETYLFKPFTTAMAFATPSGRRQRRPLVNAT
jgi:hypothetical protein